jgi:phosphoribosylformylglycinamidine cyclo-ligase
MNSPHLNYKQSGVDLSAHATWISRVGDRLSRGRGPQILSRSDGFAGMFRLGRRTVLVGCADGVGSKTMLALKAGRLHDLGIDLVAANVNDLITCGATPLFLLDYIACHKLDPNALGELLDGVEEGCRLAGCALLGGETAELPDIVGKGLLDLAGFAVGVVDEDKIIDPSRIAPGDVLIGLSSSGVHANGFSFVRRIMSQRRLALGRRYPVLDEPLSDALLRTTRIYVPTIVSLLKNARTRRSTVAMAHITGGGLESNIARILGAKCDARIDTRSWKVPPIFRFIQDRGVARREMYRVFNMGIGFVLVVKARAANDMVSQLRRLGETVHVIGCVERGLGHARLG